MSSLDWIDQATQELVDADLLRDRVSRSGKLSPKVVIEGKRYVSFASNDYLGIASDRSLNEIIARTVLRGGWGSGASPLIVGRTALHAELERRLAAYVEREAALLFPTGFAANSGTIPALVGKQAVVFSDAKNHASIIDGCRLSGAKVVVYPHADASALAKLMASETTCEKRLIVTDSLFSMDGDTAPIDALARLAQEHKAMLMVDEAHALGVIGPDGRGLVSTSNIPQHVDIIVGTLSKSLGSHGGFVAGSDKLIRYLANRARSYVFSTAAPVAAAATGLAALSIIRDEPKRRARVVELSDQVRKELNQRGWNTGPSEYHIVPVVVGEAKKAIELSAHMRKSGFWIPCIRPPTVPPGESCLRISLSSAHTIEMVVAMIEALDRFKTRPL